MTSIDHSILEAYIAERENTISAQIKKMLKHGLSPKDGSVKRLQGARTELSALRCVLDRLVERSSK